MTDAETTFDRLVEFLRRDCDMLDISLTPDTKLVELAKRDPEEFVYILEAIERVFEIRKPRLTNPWKYLQVLWRFRGFEIGSFVRLIDKRAVIDLGEEARIADLCAAIDARKWPANFIIPPGAIEDGLVDDG